MLENVSNLLCKSGARCCRLLRLLATHFSLAPPSPPPATLNWKHSFGSFICYETYMKPNPPPVSLRFKEMFTQVNTTQSFTRNRFPSTRVGAVATDSTLCAPLVLRISSGFFSGRWSIFFTRRNTVGFMKACDLFSIVSLGVTAL